jgi:signal transduction histidine kinase
MDDEKCAHERRLARLGEQTATVVHEIRNPLSAVLILMDRIEMSGAVLRLLPILRAVREEVAHVDRMLVELLAYVGVPVLARRRVDLAAVCASAVRLLGPAADRVELHAAEAMVDGDFDKLREIAINLLRNALEAAPGPVTCTVRAQDGTALLHVDDGGPPIPEATLARVFEPFFTTKAHGTGLGLPLVRRFVEAHGGTIEVRSSAEGTRVTVALPRLET